ncbi:DUF4844 domain-containing protein [Pseudoduganella namucuonensis]|uniref:DUF4844 domain-containing protein n=1 Tax=Pseudoduganella namucuonensis TaxID=1035707 RepID=UPI0015A65639|nr:DUF4844 domain-containing protein [Pseudoduganella namucuonensis]
MRGEMDSVAQLQGLAAQDKFAADGMLYTGVHSVALREKLNSKMNSAIVKFIALVHDKATKKAYLTLLAAEIAGFDRAKLDTEDAEQVAVNFERIMDCVGLESSDGILNNWMYGFVPK